MTSLCQCAKLSAAAQLGMEITYETDSLVPLYLGELEACKDFQSLRSLIDKYRAVSPDLAEVKMESPTDFNAFRKGLEEDRKGDHPDEEWLRSYASLAIPFYMLKAEMLSQKFGAPWGVAYLRMCAEGVVPGIDPEAAKQEIFRPIPNDK